MTVKVQSILKRPGRGARGAKLVGDALAEVLIDADGALDGVLDRLGWTKSKLLRVLEKDFKALEKALAELEERGIDVDHERLRWIRPVLQLHAEMEDDDDWARYQQLVLSETMEKPARSAESEALLGQAVARTDALLERLKALKPKKPAPANEITEFYED